MILIKLWKKEDVLYNMKHPSYHDKDTKNNAINHIAAKLADEAIFVTCEEVSIPKLFTFWSRVESFPSRLYNL